MEYLNKFEALQKRAVKWILFEQFEHYRDEDYLLKLHKLDLLPLNSKFILSDVLLFHRIVYNNICIKLPDYIVLDIKACGRPSRFATNDSPDYLKYKSTERPNIIAFTNSFFL